MMVIRKIGIVNVQLEKAISQIVNIIILNFQLVEIYHLKLTTRKKQLATCQIKILAVQLIKHNLQLVNFFP